VWELIREHPTIATLAGYMLFSNLVGALPSPDDKSSKGYRFLFAFLHGLAANLLRIPTVRNFMNNGRGTS
jgi:hypothetical protein